MPPGGIHAGPNVSKTQGASNNNPDLFLCAQPSQINSLHVTGGTVPPIPPVPPILKAVIKVSPASLNFVTGGSGSVTITNTPASLQTANNIAALIPGTSNITVQTNTCPNKLAIGASCTITFTSNTAEGSTNIAIKGNNSNQVQTQITVTETPVAILRVCHYGRTECYFLFFRWQWRWFIGSLS